MGRIAALDKHIEAQRSNDPVKARKLRADLDKLRHGLKATLRTAGQGILPQEGRLRQGPAGVAAADGITRDESDPIGLYGMHAHEAQQAQHTLSHEEAELLDMVSERNRHV